MKNFILISVALVLTTVSTWAQSPIGSDTTRFSVITTAVPFLRITPDARAAGMGDVGVATAPDINAIYWNQAKLVFIEEKAGASVSYTPWLGRLINDMSISHLSGYYKITREQAVAVSMKYFDLGSFLYTNDQGGNEGTFNHREYAFDAAYSRMLSEDFSIGVALRYIRSNLTGYFGTQDGRPAATAAGDLGIYYNKELMNAGKASTVSFGAQVSNIGGKLTYSGQDQRDFIPANLRLGGTYKREIDPFNSISLSMDLNKLLVPSPPIRDENGVIIAGRDPDRSMLSGVFGSFTDAPDGFNEEIREFMLSVGAEYWYNDSFAVRSGYFLESQSKGNRKYWTIGVGLRYMVFGIDFAYLVPQQNQHPLAETMRFTLLFNFGGENQDESVTDQ